MRRAIVKSMTASALVPQFTIEAEPRLDALAARRRELRADWPQLSYTDLFIAACARALRAHPGVNASFDDDAIVEHADVNLGIALALPDGLIAPAVREADRLTLAEIAGERERLTAAAQAGTLMPEDVFSATFTLSNLGPYGIRRFRALVVPPQAAILALGAITAEGTVSLSLSCDHRVLDGAPAAEFLATVVDLLERPDWVESSLGRPRGERQRAAE
jgi:pyruvate dehydrogenase E2 component (dihydrolipoamide acetyltransferase)